MRSDQKAMLTCSFASGIPRGQEQYWDRDYVTSAEAGAKVTNPKASCARKGQM